MIESFKQHVAWTQTGETVGNLTLGKGALQSAGGNTVCRVAIIEARVASGALGVAECDKLARLFAVVSASREPLVLYLDSAGARVSEGLPALGAFRRMYAAALGACIAAVPMITVLGSNCFGGASMLAALCDVRFFQPQTRLAMSGPSILASQAGMSALDEVFRAIADVSIGSAGRLKLAGNLPAAALPSAMLAPQKTFQARGDELRTRLLEVNATGYAKGQGDSAPLQRRDLSLLYAAGYETREDAGVLVGRAHDAEGEIALVGSIDKRAMSAWRAMRIASIIAEHVEREPSRRLHILMDCDAHSAAIDDEKLMLSSYLAYLSEALLRARQRGMRVTVVVLGKLGGGIYLALAAAAEVHVVYGGEIQLLPGKAIAAILGDVAQTTPQFADYLRAGVAERELKIGMV
jgi:acetyl-CoA carboxylase beta subunit